MNGERTSLQDSWNDLTASVRLVHRIDDERFRLFGGISQGFRAPNLSDLTRLDSARSNEIETPVIGLDAEKFITYEIGFKAAGQAWDGQVSAYYTDIDDLIIRTPTGAIIDGENEITKRNSSGGYIRGIEIESRYRFSEAWLLFGNLAWMYGEVGTYPTSEPLIVDEPIDRLMPVQLYLGTRWQPEGSGYWLEGLISSAAKADKLSTRDRADTDRIPPGGTPGYAILTLRAGWQISDSLKLSLALENLFDEDYRVHGSGLNEPGRNLLLSVFWTG